MRMSLCLLGCVFVALTTNRSSGAVEVLTDAQLFAQAQQALETLDRTEAAMALYAYIQRQPEALKRDAEHRHSVEEALEWARQGIADALAERDRLKAEELARNTPAGMASTSSGLTDTPRLVEPKPLPILGLAQGVHVIKKRPKTYPLAVRGGGKLTFHFLPKSKNGSNHAELTVTFARSPRAATAMPAGSAAWQDRVINKDEPNRLLITDPILADEGLGATWSAAGSIRFDWKLLAKLMHEKSVVYFDAYNDGKGHLVATKVRTDLGGT